MQTTQNGHSTTEPAQKPHQKATDPVWSRRPAKIATSHVNEAEQKNPRQETKDEATPTTETLYETRAHTIYQSYPEEGPAPEAETSV